jgi:L,D-transpeptidase catalytic domain
MRVYDANGLFAESPVSTGMPGHPTPMGVFSVIQKHKYHHSNIYSGAPMPYMQRITWSGVAMHAGVLPGHAASHGCIRMPMAFAVKMWNWTKMGARVVVTPGDVTPASFSHPLLAALKVQPQPTASDKPKADPAATADKAAEARDIAAEAKVELRSTVGHDPSARLAADEARTTVQPQTRTADAGNMLPGTNRSATMSDVDAAASESAKVVTDKSNEKPAQGGKAEPVPPAEPRNDQSRPADVVKAASSKADAAAASKRAGQIAVFVSRKDSKLYVRQNFAPLYDVPVSISPDDRPLGTHVFTVQVDKGDSNTQDWSVVSLPAPVRHADRRGEDERKLRRRKIATAVPVEVKPSPEQNSPTEALDRLKLPADAMARIAETLSTGASIIISDQGIAAGETGEGTDFIVRLR